MELIRKFNNISKSDASLAGGKGASLGEMSQAGFPVPAGFVILASTFDKFLHESDLKQEIEAILDTVNHEEIHTIQHASEKIQKLILDSKMPADTSRSIKESYEELQGSTLYKVEPCLYEHGFYVAVRSSATAEDSASAAWAGQLDTFLNTTEDTLLENTKRCWASLFTARAIFYRFEKGLHKSKISVAVVVQKMVVSDVAGIAFSVHPVTEDKDQLIIEAAFGLGEAVVSGQITPDSYVVSKHEVLNSKHETNLEAIIDKNIVEQERAIFRKEGGGDEWQDLEAKGKKQKLSDEQIIELSKLIIKIENHYGFPCDIEWALEGETFYITQSRPITTLS